MTLNMGREAMAEQVAAELEDRPFDKLRFGNRLSTYLTAHPQDLKAYGETIRRTMNDTATQVNGYPSKGAPNYRPPLVAIPGEFRTGQTAEPAHVDPAVVDSDPTHPATDLSQYR